MFRFGFVSVLNKLPSWLLLSASYRLLLLFLRLSPAILRALLSIGATIVLFVNFYIASLPWFEHNNPFDPLG
jgi:hypothetical protein